MSDSDRSQYVALGLSVIGVLLSITIAISFPYWAGHSSGYREAETKHYKTEYADRTDDRIRDCAASADPVLLAECIEKAVTDNHENQRDESDLNAQRQMADWAFGALIIASGGLLVTGTGTGFLLWQIMLTRKAVEDTGKATKAMERQNEIAEAAQRPWLAVSLEMVGEAKFSDKGLHMAAYIVIRNVGSSPAHNVYVKLDVFNELGPVDGMPDRFCDACLETARHNNLRGFVMAPNEETRHFRKFKLPQERFPPGIGTSNVVLPLVMVSATYRGDDVEKAKQTAKGFIIEWVPERGLAELFPDTRDKPPSDKLPGGGQGFIIGNSVISAQRMRVRHGSYGRAV